MNLLSILGNVAGGGLLGLAGQLAIGWLDLKRTRDANAHELAKIEAMKGVATAQAQSAAFTAAQSAEAATNGRESPWAANVKTLWRPFLTLLLIVFAAFIYRSSTPEARADIAGEIVTCATASVFFWFGARYEARLRGK